MKHCKMNISPIHQMLQTSERFEWLDEVLSLLEPPEGYITDNGESNETTAVLCMVMEGLMIYPEHPQYSEAKAAFLACCEKLWNDNARGEI